MKIRFCKQNLCDRDTIQPPRQPIVANRYPCRHNFSQKSAKCLRIPENRRIFASSIKINDIRATTQQYMYNNKNFKIMTQNFMSASALTMTELENVNGGIRVKTTDPRKKTFEIRVK